MRQVVFLSAVLIGTYLVVSYATGAGQLLGAGGNAYAGAVRALQGR